MQKPPKSYMENPCVGVPAIAPSEDPTDNHVNYETYDLMRVKIPAPTSAQMQLTLSELSL